MRKPRDVPLEVYLLGLVEFEEAHRLQRRLAYDLGERPGAALVLCEHPPTITVGRGGSRSHIVPDDATLRASGIRAHWVNRGGGCVLHVPGQLVAYLSLSLDHLGLSVRQYVDGLHQTLAHVLEEFDLAATTRPDLPGLFLGSSRVGTVGVSVNRWIASHGMTLNVGPYLAVFDQVLDEPGPRGLPLRQTSMESRRQRQAPVAKVRESMIRQVERVFELEHHHVFTHHPLIRRKVVAHAHAAISG